MKVRGEAQPQSRSGRQDEEEEEEGWSRSALADCPGCPGLTPSTAVRTPLPHHHRQGSSSRSSLHSFTQQPSLSPCSGGLPLRLTSAVARQPRLIYVFFPSPLPLDLQLGSVRVCPRNAKALARSPPPSSPCGGIHSCLLLLLPAPSPTFQGKPRERFTGVIHVAVLVLELYVPAPSMLHF